MSGLCTFFMVAATQNNKLTTTDNYSEICPFEDLRSSIINTSSLLIHSQYLNKLLIQGHSKS